MTATILLLKTLLMSLLFFVSFFVKADGVPGEISRAEAAHVLSFAGIPQVLHR